MQSQYLAALTAEIQQAVLEIDRNYKATSSDIIQVLVRLIQLYFLDIELQQQDRTPSENRNPREFLQ